jgi:HK97 family phage prohead protease
MIERRRGLAEVRAVTDEAGTRTVTLHCIRPGVVDDYGSMWMPDTFDQSLAQRLPTLVWSHDWSDPLGRGVDYRVGPDGPEVMFEFDNFDDVPQARRAYAQVRSGTIRDCSVGFSNTQRRDPTDAERAQYPGIREVIEKADLDEVSLVLRGAVPGAKVLAVRSAMVAEDTVLELARKVAAGTLTHAEAKAALALVADDDTPTPDPAPAEAPPDPETPAEEPASAADVTAELAAAEQILADRFAL